MLLVFDPSQYTVWCWVLIDSGRNFLSSRLRRLNTPCGAGCLSTKVTASFRGDLNKSQYTVWCWVLIDVDEAFPRTPTVTAGLNTPCGAGCLSTLATLPQYAASADVSIHRVVLGAYRPEGMRDRWWNEASQYTVWCWVLIDTLKSLARFGTLTSQYTVWCWVLIDFQSGNPLSLINMVSIHRVVLGAYRPHVVVADLPRQLVVSIHRVVLGAYRQLVLVSDAAEQAGLNTPCGAGCLSTANAECLKNGGTESQYTVWCWVLIDPKQRAARRKAVCLNTPCGAGCLSTNKMDDLTAPLKMSQYTVWCWVLIDFL